MNTQIKVGDTCEKCGWPVTEEDDGTPMHCGRKYYQNDYAFCLEKQCEKLRRELSAANDYNREIRERNEWLNDKIDAANERIKLLKSSGNELLEWVKDGTISDSNYRLLANAWQRAKENKP
jgi:predicted nuclease with TOPRIM domain